jgi:hypothetical protein
MYRFKMSLSVLVWIIVVFIAYLLSNMMIATFTSLTFAQAMSGSHNFYMFIFVYWWFPALFIAIDVYNYCNEN